MPEQDRNGQLTQADRYKEAATNALEMIDWCIGYFVGIHKHKVASRLARRRGYIKDNLMRDLEEPLLDRREICVLLDRLSAALRPADDGLTR